jgi:hypothetical protein
MRISVLNDGTKRVKQLITRLTRSGGFFPVQVVDYQWSRSTRILATIAISVRLSLGLPAWADMLYFADGHPLKTKVVSVTSDIIELKAPSSGWRALVDQPGTQVVRRNTLLNRQDTVTLLGHKPYVGEILFMDSTSIDMLTSEGKVLIPRNRVRKITLGTLPLDATAAQTLTKAVPDLPANMNTPMQVETPADASPSTSAAGALAKSVPSLTNPPSSRIPADSQAPEPGVEPVYYQSSPSPVNAKGQPESQGVRSY